MERLLCSFCMQYPISSSLQPYMVGPVFHLKIDDKLSSELLSPLLDITQLVGSRTGVYQIPSKIT